MYSNLSSSPMYTATRPSCAMNGLAPSCAKRPSAVRLTGARVGSRGSISTIQPKRNGSVGVRGRSKRAIDRFPRVQRVRLPHAPAAMRFDDVRIDVAARLELLEIAEVVLDVFLGGQIRAPRRLAAGAIAERAERAHAVRIGLRPQQRRAARRAADVDRRFRRDAPVEARVLDHLPAAADARDLDDGHALRRLATPPRPADACCTYSRPRRAARRAKPRMPGKHQLVERVFVVDAQDAAIAARIERKEMNGVAVRAELTLLPLGGAGLEQHTVGEPRRVEIRSRRPQTLAPAHEHVVACSPAAATRRRPGCPGSA